jgi:hypothetical protein
LFTKNLPGPLFKKHMATYCGEWQYTSVQDLWILNGRVSWVMIERSQVGSGSEWYPGSKSYSELFYRESTQGIPNDIKWDLQN